MKKGVRKKLRVGILFGGKSSEHDVSISSACSLLESIDRSKYEIIPIGIDRGGKVLGRIGAYEMLKRHGYELLDFDKESFPYESFGIGLTGIEIDKGFLDVVFPIMHGPNGEDGVIQGLLEFAGLPYVGSGVLGSAICMDKDIMKKVVGCYGISQLPYETLRLGEWLLQTRREIILDIIEKRMSYPIFVKPARMGSSVGVSKVLDRGGLVVAVDLAFRYGDKVILEQGIKAREFEVGLLGDDKNIINSVIGEVVPSSDFYDYEAKYSAEQASELIIPAVINDKELEDDIIKLSHKVFSVLECYGLSRADFLFDVDTNSLYFNEINTIPGFTKSSMYPKLFECSGISYSELVDKLIQTAMDRTKGEIKN